MREMLGGLRVEQMLANQRQVRRYGRIWDEAASQLVSPDDLTDEERRQLVFILIRTRIIIRDNELPYHSFSLLYDEPTYDPLDTLKLALAKAGEEYADQQSMRLARVYGLAWWVIKETDFKEGSPESGKDLCLRLRTAMMAALYGGVEPQDH